jgi:hypothetical protein
MVMTPTRPRRPPREPERIDIPAGWEQLFTDDEILEAIRRVDRLRTARAEAMRAAKDAEAALDRAALEDRDALAAALHSGSKPPRSDERQSKAAADLAEAERQAAASREAFAIGTQTLRRTVEERAPVELELLSSSSHEQEAIAFAELEQLEAALSRLAGFRAAEVFLRSGGTRGRWSHPLRPTAADTLAHLSALIEPSSPPADPDPGDQDGEEPEP